MTSRQLNKLLPGDRVAWMRPGEPEATGMVIADRELNKEPPYRSIKWNDGQITDGRDHEALRYVHEATEPKLQMKKGNQ